MRHTKTDVPPLDLPERLYNPQGDVRRVGFEFEFAGLELDQICALIIECYGGYQEPESHVVHKVRGTRWGDFLVEIDTVVLRDRQYMTYLHQLGFELEPQWQTRIDDLLARIAATFVPHEIVTPPVPMTEAGELEHLRRSLQAHHAEGTRASPLYAFGTHINPEVPALDVDALLGYLRAYLILEDWLKLRSRIDLARRIVPFINDFPEPYARLVVDPGYAPDQATLIDDYLLHNPTRNRPLDMLPLFTTLDRQRVMTALPDDMLTKPRPTFHYRLPNCAVDEPEWTIAEEWSGWLAVERLAGDPEALRALGRRFLKWHRETLSGIDEQWAGEIGDWVAAQSG